MLDKVIYYAIIDELSTRENPAGVLRRTYSKDGGRRDEVFTRNLVWKQSSSLAAAERGDLQNDFVEISEEEADQIVARIRATVSGAPDTP